MTRHSLKSTTAILAAISLLQPVPALAQSNANANANAAGAENRAEAKEDTVTSAEAEATAQAAAEAQAAVDAAEAAEVALVEADAKALAMAEAAEQSAKDAQAAEKARAEAQADAAEKAEADAAEAETEAAEEVRTEARAEAGAIADEEAKAQAAADAELAAQQQIESAAPAQSVTELSTDVPDDALAAEADAETAVDVTTEMVTEQTSRSSDEEFKDWTPEDLNAATGQQGTAPQATSNGGMSDLEKAGLLALGAAVVGGILLNGQRVAANTGDRVVVVDDDNDYRILKDDDALLRQPGSDVRTQRFSDGSTRSNVMRGDGSEIVTIRAADGRVLRRVLIEKDGREYMLFDDTQSFEPVVVRNLPKPPVDTFDYQAANDRAGLRAALLAADQRDIGRSFSLQQVRDINEVRQLSPEINLRNVTFATASAAIQPSQAKQLQQMGTLMRDVIAEDPTELFLIEGYTDATGEKGYNLLLSDRRAESVALAFNEYFDVPAENMVVQGYGERFLKIPTEEAERVNRRVAVRRITTLMRQSVR